MMIYCIFTELQSTAKLLHSSLCKLVIESLYPHHCKQGRRTLPHPQDLATVKNILHYSQPSQRMLIRLVRALSFNGDFPNANFIVSSLYVVWGPKVEISGPDTIGQSHESVGGLAGQDTLSLATEHYVPYSRTIWIQCSRLPLARSHIHSLSSIPVLMIYTLVQVRQVMESLWPWSLCTQPPVIRSHSRTEPSSAPLAAARGAVLSRYRAVTPPLWPWSVNRQRESSSRNTWGRIRYC